MHNGSGTCNLTLHIALLEEEEMPFELELNGVIHYKLFITDLSESYTISTCIFNCFGNSGSVPKKKKKLQVMITFFIMLPPTHQNPRLHIVGSLLYLKMQNTKRKKHH